ncbi:MAG TPA: hypothetical protein VKV26_22875 [Dehalococcoidia bacterium]|nr:hypothetical protein [Dehalococcoidia bacterium]
MKRLIDAQDALAAAIAHRGAGATPWTVASRAGDLTLYCDPAALAALLTAYLHGAADAARSGVNHTVTVGTQGQWIVFRAPGARLGEELAELAKYVDGEATCADEVLTLRLPAADWSPSHRH